MPPFDFDELLRENIFGLEPQIPFQTALQNNPFAQRGGQGRQNFFNTQFDTIFNQFLGQLGGALNAGTPVGDLPTFSNFSTNFDFQGFANQFSPRQRGRFNAPFAPRTRFLNF